jgi:hypothetical protein
MEVNAIRSYPTTAQFVNEKEKAEARNKNYQRKGRDQSLQDLRNRVLAAAIERVAVRVTNWQLLYV